MRDLSPRPPSFECLSSETVSAYIHHLLSSEDVTRAEQHLYTCDYCLTTVMEAFRITPSPASAKGEPVPAALKAQVAALWKRRPEKEQAAPVSRLVIHFTQKGLKLLERYIAPPLRDIQELLVSLPAYRTEEGRAPLTLRLTADQAEISIRAVQEGKGAGFSLIFSGKKQEVLAGQRIFLHQHGEAVFSARTDDEGALRMPRLEPGIYEVTCPGLNVTFQVELRL